MWDVIVLIPDHCLSIYLFNIYLIVDMGMYYNRQVMLITRENLVTPLFWGSSLCIENTCIAELSMFI